MDIKIEKKKGIRGVKPRYWFYGAMGVALLIAIIVIATGDMAHTLKVEEKALYVVEAQQAQFDDFVRVSGRVAPISLVQLSPQEGGIVCEKVVEEGATVKAGDVIVRLSNSNLDLQILNAEAELAEKQNLLRNTQISMEQDLLNNRTEQAQLNLDVVRKRRAYEQRKRLYDERLISKEEFLQAQEDYELSQRKQALISERLQKDSIYRLNQMDQMEENLANMRRNVLLIRERKEHLNVTSPIDGELGQLNAELGQSIASGMQIGQINVLSDYKVEAEIDEAYIDRVTQGLLATFERGGQAYNMQVRKVFPEVRSNKFRIELVFDGERPDNIRSGQTYYLNLQLGQPTQAIIVPKGSFYASTGGKWIFVLNADGSKAHRRSIRIGRQNPLYYEVLEGLAPGDRVIVNGYESYGDAQKLSIK